MYKCEDIATFCTLLNCLFKWLTAVSQVVGFNPKSIGVKYFLVVLGRGGGQITRCDAKFIREKTRVHTIKTQRPKGLIPNEKKNTFDQ